MDIGVTINKLSNGIKKYRYPLLILLVGLLLMAIPSKVSQKSKVRTETEVTNKQTLEVRLSEILSQVSGAGKVEVLLTTISGEEVIYQTNQDSSMGNSSENHKSNTVTISDSSRNQSGLIKQINPERYGGAIVLCQGADDPGVCLAIVDAVSKVTGLGANKISVLKMN